MTRDNCPICDSRFDSPGQLKEHAWDEHSACHYCGSGIETGEKEQLYHHWLIDHPDALSAVDYRRAENSVDTPGIATRYREGGVSDALDGIPRRAVLVGGGLLAAGGIGGGAIVISDSVSDANAITTDEAGPVGTAPVPSSPDEHRYATMGMDSASVTVTYFGSWKCPACQSFGDGFFKTLVSEYVTTGDVTVRFRNLAYFRGSPFLGSDAPNAGHAGLAVWNTDPESYWRFHEVVFRNQPPESRQWATAPRLGRFAEAAGVSDPDAIETAVDDNRYEAALQDTARVAAQTGISGTPSLLVDGAVLSPLSEQSQIRTRIENALEDT